MNANNKLEWLKFDTQTLPDNLLELLNTYRDLEAQVNEAKKAFTDAFTEAAEEAGMGAPKGHDMIISLKFKDVSIAYQTKGATKSSVERVGFGKVKRNKLTPRK